MSAARETPERAKVKRMPARYVVRVDTGTTIQEVSVGTDLEAEIAKAVAHHQAHGQKVWVWRMRDGRTVHRIERREGAGGAS